ncbi:hypothetical protein ATY30_14280 [Sinorhizobium americanum]|uniref:Uncharacterized protein n=1 Tax=Sinorhizobium americanum TaxID=194963 RepID=A0A2S3YN79_9HYPH|nr:hypothetical protein CO656_28925 [Sinorhizobium sp. FG01]PDT47716.1 hypothetical protein CO664_29675 [Sinorhizobium sp. NG07B]POH29840.1 hypothetical protein ATY30_14280 [Sinorhizobium americanum]POH30539.1 hypothetical protein ATY31_14830 [Sinorhizobium americanum]
MISSAGFWLHLGGGMSGGCSAAARFGIGIFDDCLGGGRVPQVVVFSIRRGEVKHLLTVRSYGD